MANSKAQAFKEKGNAAFKAGDYPTAIGHYTSAILADPDRKDVTFPLNRAAAYLKLGKYEDTERDCNTVLSISGSKSNVKALFRRGQARVGLGKLFEAQQDFTQVLSQEPSNASASDELKNVTDLIQKEKAKKSKVLPNSVPSRSTTTTTSKPEVKRRRVPIRIIGDTSSVPPNGPSTKSTTSKTTATPVSASSSASTTRPAKSNPPEANPSSMATKSTDSDSLTKKTDTLQAISSRPLKPKTSSSSASIASDDRMDVDIPLVSNPPSTSQTNSTSPLPAPPSSTSTSTADSNKPKQESSSFKEAKQARDAKSLPRVGGGIFRVSGQNTIFASRGGGGSEPAPPVKDKEKETQQQKNDDDDKMDIVVSPSPNGTDTGPRGDSSISMVVSPSLNPPSRPSPPLPTPTTLFDFSRTWYALKSPWERWVFLNTIPPTQFPGLCKTSLEPSLLVSILDVFLTILTSSSSSSTPTTPTPTPTQTQTKTQIRAYMDEFARIPRFSTIVLFLSKPEREVARRVWEELGVDGNRIGGVWMSVGGK